MQTFNKHNHSQYPDSLLAEAKGLKTLARVINDHHIKIRVPDVKSVCENELVMTRIYSRRSSVELQQRLGTELAKFHSIRQSQCGFETDNFIGLNPQVNILSDDWSDFFCNYRLGYQIRMIKDSAIRSSFEKILNDCQSRLQDWLNEHCEHFSLLHGDLWSGNVMYDSGEVWMIDPAVYYGDSEVDIAMTQMFGGFSSHFYQAYQSIRPLSPVYEKKKTIYNLYHYLNHYNLFGSGYLSACEQGIQVIKQL